jgi:DNA-binding protein H-NS
MELSGEIVKVNAVSRPTVLVIRRFKQLRRKDITDFAFGSPPDNTLGGENFRSTCSPLPNTVMWPLFWEMEMARTNLGSMSVDALLKLRDDIEKVLSSKANELKNQLARLGSEIGPRMRGRGSSLKGRKVAVKYRDKAGNTWAGRGAQPVWLREKLKAGAKLKDFAVQKTVASRKASPRKSKKRRRAKR